MLLRAFLQTGQMLLIQESYDPSWHAYLDETELEVREDGMGQMLVVVPPGQREILMQFQLPMENFIGRIVTVLSLVAVAALAMTGRRNSDAVVNL
jgi:uncharacterized membrane protein YfhO